MTGPQCFDSYATQEGATCALGAALRAIGDKSEEYFVGAFWPWVDRDRVRCPECASWLSDVECAIAHLNDNHRLTREQIADWVATIEPVEQAEAISVEVDSTDLVAK